MDLRPFLDAAGRGDATPSIRLATVSSPAVDDASRSISYIFSDESVARDGHTIAADGWQLANFLSNPVFLWCHDQSAPPVGRVSRIERTGALLRGTVQYADAETYPFADTIFRLTKGGFLNATSVSWLPVEWSYSTDKKRPGGIDFKRQELLEVSAVPVPALPSALVTARAQGINTKPLFDWAERMLDAHDHIAVPRADLEALRREARMPSPRPAGPVDPEPASTPPANPETTGTGAPEVVGVGRQAKFRTLGKDLKKRGLYELSQLCSLLSYAEYVYESVCWEAEEEGDGSPVPARMAAWLDEGNAIIAAMAVEETTENMKGGQEGRSIARQVRDGVSRALEGLSLTRQGKRLSAETERCMRDAHGHVKKAAELIGGVVDPEDDENPEGGDGDDEARALRARRAAALKRKHTAASN